MARVEAMNFGMLQAKNISSKAKTNDISSISQTNGASSTQKNNSFDKFLSDRKDETVVTEKQDVSKTEVSVDQNRNVEKQDFVSDSSVEDNPMAVSDMKEQLQALEAEMKKVVKDILEIDEETLEQTMAAMGIVITDLLKPEILQEFVLQTTGGEGNIDFLTNEQLLQNFQNVMESLGDIVAQQPDVVMSLMEVLESPLSFEEFFAEMNNSEISGNAERILQEENILLSPNGEEMILSETEQPTREVPSLQVEETTAKVADVPGQMEKPLHDVETDQAKQISSDMVEKITVTKDSEQGFAGSAFGEEQSEDAGDNMLSKQESAGILLQEQAEISKDSSVAAPLFAEQFDMVQGNISEIYAKNVDGLQRMQQMVDIVNQVSEQIRSTVDATTTTLEMQLNPESLGKVLLTISSKEGVMTANFQVQSEEARQALESQMFQLRETLEAKNLKVESVDVQISDFSFNQSNEAEGQMKDNFGGQGKKKFDFDVAEEEETEGVEETPEQMRHRVMLEFGGSVDFTA